jgi:hypothetical protein
MPITIDNGLPHITFTLGSDFTHGLSLCGLMDTCSALNTGYLLFHQWVMSAACPALVAEYLAFDAFNPFEPVKLGGTIRDPTDFDQTNHGNLTAIIRYHTPYVDITGAPITFLLPSVPMSCSFAIQRSSKQIFFYVQSQDSESCPAPVFVILG